VERALYASVSAHVNHHLRLYAALVLGMAVFVATARYAPPLRLTAGCDTFFGSYLVSIGFVMGWNPESLRRRALVADEGILVVVMIVLGAVASSCIAIIAILHQSHGKGGWPLALALAGAPLGWFTLHLVAAFHYANLYYEPGRQRAKAGRPLQFPGDTDPGAWDFVYYAFVVGMTAQVSDVQVTGARMRRATLGHGVVSFFFNTVLIAMAVNAVVTIAT
jgi:uncharacterized membrane protein